MVIRPLSLVALAALSVVPVAQAQELLSNATILETSGQAFNVTLGDFDNDGDLDAYVPTSGDDADDELWLNSGDGVNYTLQTIANTPKHHTSAAIDLNDDGWLDIVVGGTGSPYIRTLMGSSSGFTVGQSIAGRSTSGITIGDFNNDGHPDAAFAHGARQNSSVYLNNGDGTLVMSQDDLCGSGTIRFVAAHFNDDASLDLACMRADFITAGQ